MESFSGQIVLMWKCKKKKKHIWKSNKPADTKRKFLTFKLFLNFHYINMSM